MLWAISMGIRLVAGIVSIFITFLVLDAIHDRNTEIIVACLGLLYSFIFVISRRWQYYGLTVFSLFGMTVARLQGEPFDQSLRDELGMPQRSSYVTLTVIFAALIELICVYRLLTSLLGHGWERLSAPVHSALGALPIENLLSRL